MAIETNWSRRTLLKNAAAGGLLLAIGIPPAAAQAVPGDQPDLAALGAFIRIGSDNKVSLIAPCVEMGQGSHTALGMILADELGADWSQVSIESPPLGVVYRVPGRPMQSTSGSQMVRRWTPPLRRSAAAAREMLTAAAATQWGVPAASCTVRDSFVLHAPTDRRLAFGELVQAAARLPEPKEPVLRKGSLVGTSVPRVDVPSKVDGSARYGVDVRLAGMLYAAIRQAPVYGARLVSVNEKDVRTRRGVVDIVKLPDAVVVVADNFWRAKNAVAALEPVFSPTPNARISTREIMASQRLQLSSPIATPGVVTGDAAAVLATARNKLSADYGVQFLHHATMEPMTCTVSVTDQRCELWLSSQNLTGAADAAAKITGLPLEKIVIHPMLLGGGLGRKFEQDAVEQAVLIGKAVKRPVQLVWSREEDVQHGFYRPAMAARVTAALDEKGSLAALTMCMVGPSVLEHTLGSPFVRGVDPVAMLGVASEAPGAPGSLQQYTLKDFRADYIYQPTHVPVGYWRSVGASENAFFLESFIDEAAARAKVDPYQFRRHLMRDSARAVAVLDKAAAEAGWGKPLRPGHHRGIAFSDCVGSFIAQVAEISVVKGAVKVHRVVCVIDCGTAVSPDNVKAQVEGSIVMGLGSAMHEQITVEGGRCVQSNFHDYRVLALKDTPPIDVHIVNSGGPLGGVGEAAVPAVAPALCNALFAATGRRLRTLPLSQHGLKWA